MHSVIHMFMFHYVSLCVTSCKPSITYEVKIFEDLDSLHYQTLHVRFADLLLQNWQLCQRTSAKELLELRTLGYVTPCVNTNTCFAIVS